MGKLTVVVLGEASPDYPFLILLVMKKLEQFAIEIINYY
jgi:hypothetical protein